MIALQRGAADREGRFEDARMLRAERDSLAAFLVGQANLAAENRRLRQLLGMRERVPNSFVAAEVIEPEGSSIPGTILLTAGARQGVEAGAAIVTAQGLVGMVREVHEDDAVGFDWTHPDFRASAVSVDGETYGIVEPRTGRGEDRLLALTSTALHTVPKRGTLIVTSGSGQTYPRGIPIGTVIGAESDASNWQRIYLIRPMVSPGEMDHVLVLRRSADRTTYQDLAAAWGIRLQAGTQPDSIALPVAPPPSRPATTTATRPRPSQPRPSGPRLLGRPVEPRIQDTQDARPGQTPGVTGVPAPTRPQPRPDTVVPRRDR
ncbi:MAG TPA: rod shape-determining protein MreC [Longimicrobiaceae bacterium]|nr:rod shape-determining protein MreC [Longimicrobiaceae bacterium]